MPKVIKKRMQKKKPIQEDNVKSAALHVVDSLKKRQKRFTIAVAIIAGVFAVIVFFSLYTSSQYKKAHSLEVEATQYYYGEDTAKSLSQTERWKKALELYQQSLNAKATPTALFYLGNSYYNLGDNENAIKQYNAFIDKFSSARGTLPLVYQKLSSIYFKTGQNEKALEVLGRLEKVEGGIFKDTALVFEARYYDSAGDSAKALDRYRELVTAFPASPWIAEANSKVSAADAQKADGANKEAEASPVSPIIEQTTEAPDKK